MYYVYHLIDSSTQQPFYVGKGSGNRSSDHLADARKAPHKQENQLKCNKINALLREGVDITISRVALFDTEAGALEFEADEILKYGRICNGSGILTNIQGGGEQPPAQPKKTVYCFDKDGQLARVFDSTFRAAAELGVTVSVIQNCIAGRCHTSCGLAMFYTSVPPIKDIQHRFANRTRTKQTVFQIDDAGVVATHDSITGAAESIGSESRRVSSAIKSGRRHRGWYWSLSAPV